MLISADTLNAEGIRSAQVLEVDESGNIAGICQHGGKRVDLDFSGFLAVPGFVDLHVHGAGGADFMDGAVESVRNIARTHARFGTTSLLATTLTAERDDIDRAIRAATHVMDNPEEGEAAIRGIHLEGPYICSKRRGAQPATPIRSPEIDELDHWYTLSNGRIKQITLAPELPGALPFIRHAVSLGVNVSIGHTDASYAEAEAAIDAGARMGTHLFNAMTALTHRQPGTVGALLSDDRAFCELICDGFHVDPAVVKLAVRAKGISGIVLITDAMSGTAMADGDYQLGGTKVIVKSGTAKFDDGTLAGSVLTMNKAFKNVIDFAGVTPSEASIMSASNAAYLIGLANRIGSLEVGKAADIAIVDQASGSICATIGSGRLLYRRS